MRKRFILLAFAVSCGLIFINGYFNKAKSDVTGAPAYETGSPYDGSSCTGCHGGHGTFTGRGTITTNIPIAGYTASTAYTITATLYSPALRVGGFELSPQDTTGTGPIGTLTAGSNNQLASGQQGWVTHTQSSATASGGTCTWTMTWTAPTIGKGPVVFYAAFNRSNDNGQDSGDSIFLTTLKVYEDLCGSVPGTPGAISGNTSPCSATSVTYSVAAVTGATNYIWTLPGGWTGNSTTNSITVTTGTTGGTISVKASSGCGSSAASSQTVTVTGSTTPAVSISAGNQSICSGTSVTFTVTPTNGGAAPTYQWKNNGNIISGATGSTYSSSALANGDAITVEMTSNAACVTTTTATSNTITMTVTPVVIPAVSINSNVGTSICSGQSAALTASPTNGGTTPAYQWYKNGSAISGATLSTYTTTTLTNNDALYVVMTSTATCALPASVTSDTLAFAIVSNATPSVSIAAYPGSTTCAGASVTFTAVPVNGGSAPAYEWKKNGNVISGATLAAYTTNTLANNDTVTVVMTSNSACVSTAQAISNAIIITISANVAPSVSIVSNAGNGTVCSGVNVTFTATPVNGGASPNYQWLDNALPIGGAYNSSYVSASLTNDDVISVSMTSGLSCASPSSATSNGITMNISASGAAAVSISSNAGNSICEGATVTFTATPVSGGSSPSYQWTKNGTDVGTNSTIYIDNSLAGGDVINCALTSSLTCASPSVASSNSDTMAVHAPPAANITVSNDTLVSGAATAYQWYDNNIVINNAISQMYLPASNGSYSVVVTDGFGCQNSAVYDVTYITGIQDVSASDIKIYPNPAGETLFIDMGGEVPATKVLVRLYDLSGQLLLDNENALIGGSKASLNVETLPGGIYLLQISRGEENAYRKLVVGR